MEKIFSCTAQTVSSALKAPHSCANSHLMNFQQQFKEKISGKTVATSCLTHTVEKRAKQKLNTTLCSNLQIGALNPFVATVPFSLSLTLPHSLSLSLSLSNPKLFRLALSFFLYFDFQTLNCWIVQRKKRKRETEQKNIWKTLFHCCILLNFHFSSLVSITTLIIILY